MRVGIDLAKTKRWEALVKKHPQRVGTIFTEEELAHCRNKGLHAYESMAALCAVREAAGRKLEIRERDATRLRTHCGNRQIHQ